MARTTEKGKGAFDADEIGLDFVDSVADLDPDREAWKTTQLDSQAVTLREQKIRLLDMRKKEHLSQVFKAIEKGTATHCISNGTADFFTWIPVIIDRMGGSVDEFYGSTWTMNRNNARELLSLFDQGKIRRVNMLTGDYFKAREPAVYANLYEGLLARGQRFAVFANHSKICTFRNSAFAVTVEGSANFTSNPRLEQYVITESGDLFKFHQRWMDQVLNDKGRNEQ